MKRYGDDIGGADAVPYPHLILMLCVAVEMKLWVAMELSLVLKLALMVMSAVRESDSHPLRTDPMELKEVGRT